MIPKLQSRKLHCTEKHIRIGACCKNDLKIVFFVHFSDVEAVSMKASALIEAQWNTDLNWICKSKQLSQPADRQACNPIKAWKSPKWTYNVQQDFSLSVGLSGAMGCWPELFDLIIWVCVSTKADVIGRLIEVKSLLRSAVPKAPSITLPTSLMGRLVSEISGVTCQVSEAVSYGTKQRIEAWRELEMEWRWSGGGRWANGSGTGLKVQTVMSLHSVQRDKLLKCGNGRRE